MCDLGAGARALAAAALLSCEGSSGETIGRALRWLAEHLGKEPDAAVAMQANGASKRAVATGLAALLALACPDEALPDGARERLDASALRAARMRSIGGFAFANWLAGLDGLYLFEKALRDGAPPPELA